MNIKRKFIKATILSGAVVTAIALSSCIKKEGGDAGEVTQIQYTVPVNYMPDGSATSPNGIVWTVSGTTVMASCPAGFTIPTAVTGPISTNNQVSLIYTGVGTAPSMLQSNSYMDFANVFNAANGNFGNAGGAYSLDPLDNTNGINTNCVPANSVDDWTWS